MRHQYKENDVHKTKHVVKHRHDESFGLDNESLYEEYCSLKIHMELILETVYRVSNLLNKKSKDTQKYKA
jgi:hypothetical protein